MNFPLDNLRQFAWPSDLLSESPILRSIFLIYYLASVALAVATWNGYLKRAYYTRWFDVSDTGWLGELKWNPDVDVLMTSDPLLHASRVRGIPSWQALRDLVLLLLALMVWICGIHGLHFLGNNPTKEKTEIAAFVVGFASFAGAAVKAIYEWRLKARSENRQKWINDIRAIMVFLIANLPEVHDNAEALKMKKATYHEQHARLELLMNPSEKDHRALMALFRHAYGYEGVPIDEIPRNELKIKSTGNWKIDRVELKSRIIRLSNVMLKREWERVKHIQ